MLEHHADARRPRRRRVGEGYRRAFPSDGALVGLEQTVDDLHQGAFARAILAEQRVDFPRHQREIDPIDGADTGKMLLDPAHNQARRAPCLASCHLLPPRPIVTV